LNDFFATGDGFALSDVTSRKKFVRRIVLAGRNWRRYLVEYNSRQIERGRRLEKLNLWKWQKQARNGRFGSLRKKQKPLGIVALFRVPRSVLGSVCLRSSSNAALLIRLSSPTFANTFLF